MTTVSAQLRRRRRSDQLQRRLRRDGRVVRLVPMVWTGALIGGGLLLLVIISLRPNDVAWTFYGPLIVLAGLNLATRPFLIVCGVYVACLLLAGSMMRGWAAPQAGALVALVMIMVLMTLRARSRDRLGVHGNATENMLVDLRDGLRSLADIDGLPANWHAEQCIQSAFGDKFSGDLAVTSRSPDGRWLEIVLADLSGKGTSAGTRSLLLSGALGGLLGQVESDRLLCAVNSYLLRQPSDEAFATAVHLSLDLQTGRFSIGNAGHPAPVQFVAGSGRWSVLTSAGGPALGLIVGAQFPRVHGVLHKGDALVLYTDGVIETPDHDLDMGVDRMIGTAETLVRRGFVGGSRRLCQVAKAGESDDRAVVLLWRT